MKLATIDADPDLETAHEPTVAAVLRDGTVLDLTLAAGALDRDVPSSSLRAILANDELDMARAVVDAVEEAGDGTRQRLLAGGALLEASAVRFCAPVPEPPLILCQGLAYRAHLAEMNTPAPKEPTAFLKAASSVIGSGAAIELPPAFPDMVDFEGEFSIVIGRPCHAVTPAEAMDFVAGYTIVNDVSARDWVAPVFNPEQSPIAAAMAWAVNIQGKQLPTFTPMGPAMVTKDEVPDPHDVRLVTRLNGEVMQDAHTGDLIFPIAELIAHFSQWYSFRPGDIVTTGTPAGVGYGRDPKLFLKDGDLVEVTVAPIGTLSNPVRAGA